MFRRSWKFFLDWISKWKRWCKRAESDRVHFNLKTTIVDDKGRTKIKINRSRHVKKYEVPYFLRAVWRGLVGFVVSCEDKKNCTELTAKPFSIFIVFFSAKLWVWPKKGSCAKWALGPSVPKKLDCHFLSFPIVVVVELLLLLRPSYLPKLSRLDTYDEILAS